MKRHLVSGVLVAALTLTTDNQANGQTQPPAHDGKSVSSLICDADLARRFTNKRIEQLISSGFFDSDFAGGDLQENVQMGHQEKKALFDRIFSCPMDDELGQAVNRLKQKNGTMDDFNAVYVHVVKNHFNEYNSDRQALFYNDLALRLSKVLLGKNRALDQFLHSEEFQNSLLDKVLEHREELTREYIKSELAALFDIPGIKNKSENQIVEGLSALVVETIREKELKMNISPSLPSDKSRSELII